MSEGQQEHTKAAIDERLIEGVRILRHETLFAHGRIINETGGVPGIRDVTALEAAVAAPFATYSGQDLYESVFDKAACLMRSLSKNHPFIDGNKRTSLVMTASFLFGYGLGFREDVNDDEIVNFCIELAEGSKEIEEISVWFKEHTDKASGESFKRLAKQLHGLT